MAGALEEATAVVEALDAHPGAEVGLSPREVAVVRLIVQGVSNQEIAKTLVLSINSVKTYMRSTYRRMGVENRARGGHASPTSGYQRR